MKVLSSDAVILNSFVVKTRLIGYALELDSSYNPPEKVEDGLVINYKLLIDNITIRFGLWQVAERSVLKNFEIHQHLEFKKKKWWQFWISNKIENLSQALSYDEKQAIAAIQSNITRIGSNLFIYAQKD